MIQLEIMTRPGCHLCEEMKEALSRAGRGLDLLLKEIDISGDVELEKRHGTDIPVLFVNGRKAFKHRATEKELRARLLRESSD
ncbi:MAG: glutaredoxin family protein [Vicinamibacteria bacterium]